MREHVIGPDGPTAVQYHEMFEKALEAEERARKAEKALSEEKRASEILQHALQRNLREAIFRMERASALLTNRL